MTAPPLTSDMWPRPYDDVGAIDVDVDVDMDDPKVRRQVEHKRRMMKQAGRQQRQPRQQREWPGGAPGQHEVKKWVVLSLGKCPAKVAYDPWTQGDDFRISFREGTFNERALTLGELREAAGGDWQEMPACDWHCVTGWSCLGVRFRGIPWATVLRLLLPPPPPAPAPGSHGAETGRAETATETETETNAPTGSIADGGWTCLFQRSADGYTAGVHRDDTEGAFLAVTDGDGVMLSEAHGGPRLVFPACFGWKSAKYLRCVELLPDHRLGFWEKLGCHSRGRWAWDERWAPGTSAKVWTVLAWITSQ